MRNWLRNIGVAVFFALLVIFIIGSLKLISFLLTSDQQLANAYIAVSTFILALATVLLAGFTGLSIRSGEKREQRDRKERLLNEIIEWAVDFRKCLYSADVLGKDQKTVYVTTHLRIVSVNANRVKIETIAQKVFGDNLSTIVGEVEKSVAQYLLAIEFAVGFSEKELRLEQKSELRDKIEQARPKGWTEIDKILDEYVRAVVTSTTNLVEKCSNLMTEL